MYSPNKQVGIVDPALATQPQPAQQIPQTVQQPVQQMTNVPPAPSNTLGQAQPAFNPQAQQNSALLYGSVAQRQNSVSAPLMFTDKDKNDDGFSSTADLTAQKKYNDQLKSQKSSGETFSRISGTIQKIEKSPQLTYTAKEGKIKKTK
jgi:myosin-crossreactive antigen